MTGGYVMVYEAQQSGLVVITSQGDQAPNELCRVASTGRTSAVASQNVVLRKEENDSKFCVSPPRCKIR